MKERTVYPIKALPCYALKKKSIRTKLFRILGLRDWEGVSSLWCSSFLVVIFTFNLVWLIVAIVTISFYKAFSQSGLFRGRFHIFHTPPLQAKVTLSIFKTSLLWNAFWDIARNLHSLLLFTTAANEPTQRTSFAFSLTTLLCVFINHPALRFH